MQRIVKALELTGYLCFSALFVGQGDATLEQALACALWARFSALFVGQGDATFERLHMSAEQYMLFQCPLRWAGRCNGTPANRVQKEQTVSVPSSLGREMQRTVIVRVAARHP